MSEDGDLDALAEMLKVIKANEPKPEPQDYKLMFNTNMTSDEIRKAASEKEETEKQDPTYEFTINVIGSALASMAPLMMEKHPFDVLVERLGLNSYLLKKHMADTLILTFKSLPPEISLMLIQDVDNGALFMSMLTYIFTETVFIAAEATAAKEGGNAESTA